MTSHDEHLFSGLPKVLWPAMMNIYFKGCQKSCDQPWWTFILRVAKSPVTSHDEHLFSGLTKVLGLAMINFYFQGCQRSWDQQWCPEQWWTYIFRVARGPGTSTRPCSSPFSSRPSTCCTGSTSCQSPCTGPSGAITEISKWRKNPALYKMPQKEFSYFFYFHFIQLYKCCITNLNF